MKKLGLVLLFVSVVYWENVYSAENDAGVFEVEVLEVTGTVIKDGASPKNVPRYTISRQEITTIAPASAIDLFRGVPGVNVTQQGGQGGLTFISLRGGEPNFTVVIIDGVKVNDINNSRGGGYDFAGLDPQLIQRIDVYFGGLSSVFGSEALGGVISITTLNESVKTRAVSFEAGSYGQHAESFHIAEPFADKLIANVSGAYRDGGSAVAGDTLKRSQINVRLSSLPDNELDWKLRLFHSGGKSSAFPEDSGGDQMAVIREVEEREFQQNNVAASVNWLVNNNWRMDFSAAVARRDEKTNSPGIAPGILQAVPPVSSDSQYQRADSNLTSTVFLSNLTTIGVGMELSREEGKFDSTINLGFPLPANFDIDRDIFAVFTEINHQLFKRLNITGGLRYDNADNIEETTLRFDAKYNFVETGTDVVLQYGEGFKLPSFFALGHPLVGNRDLEPEFSKNAVVSVRQVFLEDQLQISAIYFYNRFTNLVDFDPLLFTSVNRSSVVVKGGEFRVNATPGDSFKASAHIAYTDYNTDKGVTLRRRPSWTGGVVLFWQPREHYFSSMQANYVDQFDDSSIPTGLIELDGYFKFDITFGWKLTDSVNLKLISTNLLNGGFEETTGFSNPGREFRVKLEATL